MAKMAARLIATPGWRCAWLALLLGCSSRRGPPPPAPDAAAADAARAVPDAAPDARGGTSGTTRGSRRGTGGTGGVGAMGGGGRGGATGGSTGGSGPPVDVAIPRDAQPPTPDAEDACQTARVLDLGKPRLDVVASTRGGSHHRDLPCGRGGADLWFAFTLTERELVYADTFGASFDTILAFTEGCEAGGSGAEPACVDDACGGKQSQVVALLAPGKHYLVLSGVDRASGDATVHVEHAPVGAGAVAALGTGTAVTSGTTSGTGRLGLCEAGGPEDAYWWTSCPGFAGGLFQASTCSNTVYDSLLSLQIPRTATLVCNDDACKLAAAIVTNLPPGAGLHVLAVDGFTRRHKGAYTLSTTRP
jgi:hypothetical protein